MNKQKILDLTSNIIQEYYRNNTQPFIEYVDEDVLWYGPATGQFLSGKQSIIDAWAKESHSLTFTLGNIRLDYISGHTSFCEIISSFPVTTHYPDGGLITMNQVIHISWCERKIKNIKIKQPRMLVIHISDLYQKHKADKIYPVHFNQIYKGFLPVSDTGERIYFQGVDSFDLYLMSNTILWIDSVSNGRHSIIHTKDGEYRVTAKTVDLEKKYPDFLVRCHRCHLVNPMHIASIKRFTVTLSNGKELPIPEKKYTSFKKTVHDRWSENQS